MSTFSENTNIESLENDVAGKLRSYSLPLTVFVVIAILSFTAGRYVVNNIFSLKDQASQLSSENGGLEQKRQKLTSMDKNVLTRQAQVSVLAIPRENSGLTALSAVRSQAFEKGIDLTSLKLSEVEGSQRGGKEIGIQIEVSGTLGNILEFVQNLEKSAPIVRLSKVHMVGLGEKVQTDLELKTFWATLPKNLPPVTTPVVLLSKKDEELLREMEQLNATTLSNVTPASASARDNPFE